MVRTQSLYDKIGGKQALVAVVDQFYTRILADQKLALSGAFRERMATLFPGAPAVVRAQCCAEVALNLGHGTAAARRASPGDPLWRAAASAWAAVARAAQMRAE